MNTQNDIQAAMEYYQIGKLDRTKDICEKILVKEPNNKDALQLLGGIYYQEGRYNFAIKYFKKTIELYPDFAKAYNNLGFILLAKGQLDEAMMYIRKALQLQPDYPEAYNHMGMIFKQKEQNEEAINCFQRAIQLNPNFAEAYNNLGLSLKYRREIDEAITCFQKAIQLNPNFAEAYNILGVSLKEKGMDDEAVVCLQKAVQLNPNFAEAYANLGIVAQEKGQLDEATMYYQKVLEFNENLTEVYMALRHIFMQKGSIDEATYYLEKAFKVDPNLKEAYSNLNYKMHDVAFHGDRYLLDIVDVIISKCEFFIETGTRVGFTLAYVADKYPNILCYSCEPNKRDYKYAQNNIAKYKNANLFNKTSQEFLRFILTEKEIAYGSLLFWLDAHGSGFEWPLLEEVALITKHCEKAFMLIDDFLVPGLSCFGYDEYNGQVCSFQYIKDFLNNRHEYHLYYPQYTDKTSRYDPLRGWGLIEFGHSDELNILERFQSILKKEF